MSRSQTWWKVSRPRWCGAVIKDMERVSLLSDGGIGGLGHSQRRRGRRWTKENIRGGNRSAVSHREAHGDEEIDQRDIGKVLHRGSRDRIDVAVEHPSEDQQPDRRDNDAVPPAVCDVCRPVLT